MIVLFAAAVTFIGVVLPLIRALFQPNGAPELTTAA